MKAPIDPRTAALLIGLVPLLLATAASDAAAQRLGLTIRAGASAPVGSYAATTGEQDGHAGVGFNGGLDVEIRPARELAILISAGTAFHSPGATLIENRPVAYDPGVFYILFPLMGGAKLDLDLESVTLSGIAQIGVLIVDGPAEHGTEDDTQVPLAYVGYTMTPNLALSFGGEIRGRGRLFGGGRFYMAPDATFTGNASRFGSWPPEDEEITRSVSFVDLYLGFRIR